MVINRVKVDNVIQPLLDKNINKLDDSNDSNLLEMPDNTSDNGIGISDIPIMKISSEEKTAKKPLGSAYIHIKMSIGRSSKQADVQILQYVIVLF